MAEKTAIKASHIIAYDGESHRHLPDGVVVYEGNTIVYVGKEYTEPVDHTIDATGKIVVPGFINTHAHLAGSPLDKSFVEDRGPPQFYLSGLFEHLPARAGAMTMEDAQACVDFSMVELLRSGTTTIMEMGGNGEYVAEQAGRFGLRAYIGEMYRSARWYTPDGKQVLYDWNEQAGLDGLHRAVAFIEKYQGTYQDRIRGFLAPAQVDTCTAALLKETQKRAEALDVPVQIHVSQSVIEFQEMLRRQGKTPWPGYAISVFSVRVSFWGMLLSSAVQAGPTIHLEIFKLWLITVAQWLMPYGCLLDVVLPWNPFNAISMRVSI